MWPAAPDPGPTWRQPTPYPKSSCRRGARPARPLACPPPQGVGTAVVSQQHRNSPVQVRDCGIQRLKGGLDVGQLPTVLGGQAALQPRSGRVAVGSVARRRLLVLDRRLLPLGTDPVEHRSDTGKHPCGLSGQQLRSRRRSRRISPPIQPSKADGWPAGAHHRRPGRSGSRSAVGSWSIRWSGRQVLPLVGDEGSAMRALGGHLIRLKERHRSSPRYTCVQTWLPPPVAQPRHSSRVASTKLNPPSPLMRSRPRRSRPAGSADQACNHLPLGSSSGLAPSRVQHYGKARLDRRRHSPAHLWDGFLVDAAHPAVLLRPSAAGMARQLVDHPAEGRSVLQLGGLGTAPRWCRGCAGWRGPCG